MSKIKENEMIGYKAFNKDLTCRGFQYKIGQTYKLDCEPIPCKQGFHFCKTIAETYKYYSMSENTRICKIEAIGDINTDDNIKYCTNKIVICEEITQEWERRGNNNTTSSGYCNSGNNNSGDKNSGNCNSGYYNSGNNNSGNCNSGYCNSGNKNSGAFNSGDFNSGEWNSGDFNSGIFNSNEPYLRMFNKQSKWKMSTWLGSKAKCIMDRLPYNYSYFVDANDMSNSEKENHPEYKTIGGYVKTIIATKEDKQRWWDELDESDKQEIYNLPNFDAKIFEACTKIHIEM